MLIYKVTNLKNGKIYIGKTKHDLFVRKKYHYKSSRRRTTNSIFHKALRKYKEENFLWEVLQFETNIDDLNRLEIAFIEKYKSNIIGYNMTLGGEGGDTISMKTLKEKKRQGAKKGNIPWNKGKNMKELGYTFNNRKPRPSFTEEEKINHSISIKKSKKFQNGIKNRKPAKQVVIQDTNGNIWNRQKDLINFLKVSHHVVRAGLKSGEWSYNGVTYKVIKRK